MKDTINIKDNTIIKTNPFPGLRPFQKEDSYLFFGREKHIESVLKKIIANKFIAIIGNSGIGKSSFINCGILPKLYSGAVGRQSTNWDIFSFRPGTDPLQMLSESFYNYFKSDEIQNQIVKSNSFVKELINTNGIEGFFDLITNLNITSDNNILLYVDQFEEIFRHKKQDIKKTNEIKEFINILVECSKRKHMPVNIVITMRSDFIGECSKFPDLTTLINDSQFLIPQMTREEKQLAITGPLSVMGVEIKENLVNEILNKLGDADDQLPVMQHCLMRTWEYWDQNKIGKEPISHDQYNAIGGMDKALSVHANEIFNELSSDLQVICEKIFKNITEKGEGGRTIRRPASVTELAQISETSPENIITIVDNFRKPGRTLLTPFTNTPLTATSIVDVSHESIMRIWGTLDKWIDEEQESVKQYLRIAEAAGMHQEGKGGLLKSPELQMAIRWRDTQQPNKTWGIRHHVAFDRTMEYLDHSETEFNRAERLKERNQKKRIIFLRTIAGVISFVALIALLLFGYGLKQKGIADQKAEEANLQKEKADENALEAQKSAEIAESEKEKAKQSALEAKESAKKAKISALLAQEKAIEALNQTRIAKAAKDTAELAKEAAEKAEDAAYSLRMLSIAKSMAIKSEQETDTATKALVARQAYNFFNKYNGLGTDPDVYEALYYALKEIKGENFNSLKGHEDNVRAIVTVPNSSTIYSAGSDGKILKWNKKGSTYVSDEPVYEIPKNEVLKVNKALAISSTGEWLVSGGNYKNLRMFNTKTPGKPQILATKTETRFVSFTPDNKSIIYIPNDKYIMIYDLEKRMTKVLGVTNSKINATAIDPSGKFFAVGTEEGKIIGYNLTKLFTKTVLYKDIEGKPVTAICFNSSGSALALAVGYVSGAAYIIDMNTGTKSDALLGHTARINRISFNNAYTKLATASWDHTVRIWDLKNKEVQPVILHDHEDWVWSILFSNDDKQLLAGCKDNLVRAWPLDIKEMAETICNSGKITGKISEEKWNNYVGEDIPPECTCIQKCK